MAMGKELYDILTIAGESTVFIARGFHGDLIAIDYHHNLHSLSPHQVNELSQVWYRKLGLMEVKNAKAERTCFISTALLILTLFLISTMYEDINLLIMVLAALGAGLIGKEVYIANKHVKDVKAIAQVLSDDWRRRCV